MTRLNLHRQIDPAILNRPVTFRPEPIHAPSWYLIASAWCAGLALLVWLWS